MKHSVSRTGLPLVALALAIAFPALITSQVPGETVTVVLPQSVLVKERIGLLDDRPVHVVEFERRDGGLVPWGNADWKTSGFPLMREYTIHSTRTRRGTTEIDLRGNGERLKLRFPPDVANTAAALTQFALPGSPSSPAALAYLEGIDEKLAPGLFGDVRLPLTPVQQQALTRAARESGHAVTFGRSEYKARIYLRVDLGALASPYAALLPNQLARVAKAVNEQLATVLKVFGRPLSGSHVVDGLQLAVRLAAPKSAWVASPQPDDPPGSGDLVRWYVPLEVIARFTSDEITSQQVVDQSVVTVNGNRVELSLATWR